MQADKSVGCSPEEKFKARMRQHPLDTKKKKEKKKKKRQQICTSFDY